MTSLKRDLHRTAKTLKIAAAVSLLCLAACGRHAPSARPMVAEAGAGRLTAFEAPACGARVFVAMGVNRKYPTEENMRIPIGDLFLNGEMVDTVSKYPEIAVLDVQAGKTQLSWIPSSYDRIARAHTKQNSLTLNLADRETAFVVLDWYDDTPQVSGFFGARPANAIRTEVAQARSDAFAGKRIVSHRRLDTPCTPGMPQTAALPTVVPQPAVPQIAQQPQPVPPPPQAVKPPPPVVAQQAAPPTLKPRPAPTPPAPPPVAAAPPKPAQAAPQVAKPQQQAAVAAPKPQEVASPPSPPPPSPNPVEAAPPPPPATPVVTASSPPPPTSAPPPTDLSIAPAQQAVVPPSEARSSDGSGDMAVLQAFVPPVQYYYTVNAKAGAPAFAEPRAGGSPIYTFKDTTELNVVIVDTDKKWLTVKLPDGRTGFVSAALVTTGARLQQ